MSRRATSFVFVGRIGQPYVTQYEWRWPNRVSCWLLGIFNLARISNAENPKQSSRAACGAECSCGLGETSQGPRAAQAVTCLLRALSVRRMYVWQYKFSRSMPGVRVRACATPPCPLGTSPSWPAPFAPSEHVFLPANSGVGDSLRSPFY